MPSALELVREEYFDAYPAVTEVGTCEFLIGHLERFAGRGDVQASSLSVGPGRTGRYTCRTVHTRLFRGNRRLVGCFMVFMGIAGFLSLAISPLVGVAAPVGLHLVLVLIGGVLLFALGRWSLRKAGRAKAVKMAVREWGLDFSQDGTRLWVLSTDGRKTDTVLDGQVTFVGKSERVRMRSPLPHGHRTVSFVLVRIEREGVILTAADRETVERTIEDLKAAGFAVALFGVGPATLNFWSSEAFFRLCGEMRFGDEGRR